MSTTIGNKVSQTATRGLEASLKWHLFGREAKNAQAVEVALDQVQLDAQSLPEFSKGLQTLRSLEQGISPAGRQTMQLRLLRNLAHNSAAYATAATFPTLAVLSNVLLTTNIGDAQDRQTVHNKADAIFTSLARISRDPMTRLAGKLEHTSLTRKLRLMEEGLYLSDDHQNETGNDAARYLRMVSDEDRPLMHGFLADNLRQWRPDDAGQEAADLLAGLSRMPADEGYDEAAVEHAFNMYAEGESAKDIASAVRDFGINDRAIEVLDQVERALRPQGELDFTSHPPEQLALAL
jgi:hypothetical protein